MNDPNFSTRAKPDITSPISLINTDPKLLSLPQLPPDRLHYPSEGTDILVKLEQVHFWHRTRRDLVTTCLKREFKSPPTGLDIGCGTGWTATELTANGSKTIGIDGYPNFSKPSTIAGTPLFSGDIFGFTPKPEFDFILLLDVLEHIEDDAKFLAQAMRFLKPGGIAIIHVPAFQWLWSPTDDYAGHLRRYTIPSLKKMIEDSSATKNLEFVSLNYHYALTLPLFVFSRLLNRLRAHKTPDWSETQYQTPRWLNWLLIKLLRVEQLILPNAPFGSSVLAVVRKKTQEVFR